MSALEKKSLIFFEFISLLLVIISYILYIAQSFINYKFIKSKSKEISAERILYQNFAKEINNNIKSFIIKKIKIGNDKNLQDMNIAIKINSSYDCRGVTNGLLNEEVCQNKILNNSICCKSECCTKNDKGKTHCINYEFNPRKTKADKNFLVYNSDELFDDPKRRYCQYMSTFSGYSSTISGFNLRHELTNYSYENILLNEDSNIKIEKKEYKDKDYTDCGEIDSLQKHLFIKGQECPINHIISEPDNNLLFFDFFPDSSLGIIVNNYLSDIPPLIFDLDNVFTSGENKVTIKEINDLIKKKNDDSSEYENYYKKQDAYFYLNQIPENIRNKFSNRVKPNQKIYWYTTNYIGFDTVDDLKKFKSIFKENDDSDNPLYKMTKSIKPAIGTAIIGILLVIIYIILLIRFAKEVKNGLVAKMLCFKFKEVITLITLIIFFIIYLVYAHGKFKKIKINLDINYKKILELYNERRKQKCFLAGIILHFIACAFEVYYYFFSDEKKEKNNSIYNIQNIDKNDSTIINNNLSNTVEQIDKNVEVIQNSAERMKDSIKFGLKTKEKINKVIKFEP